MRSARGRSDLNQISRVPIASVGKYFPEKYLLSHLISGVAPQGGPEEIAKEWLDQMVKNIRNRQNVRVEAKCNMPNELRNVQPFAQNSPRCNSDKGWPYGALLVTKINFLSRNQIRMLIL